jgi:predicted component of type VI protein secretion system
LVILAALALFGCGSKDDYANDPRPPAPINISVAISPDKVTVSPSEFGAGPVTLLIANLTEDSQRLTIETQELSKEAGIKQQSSVINPQGTGTLKVDVPEGTYVVGVDRENIREARVEVGEERESSQDQLLQP